MSDLVEREAVLEAVRYDDAGRLREKVVSLIESLPPAPLPERVQAAVDLAETVVAWDLWREFDRNRRATCLFCRISQGGQIDHLSGCEYARYRAARGEG